MDAARETVGELVRRGTVRLHEAGSESARLDAELLLAHALGVERTTVLAHPEARPGREQATAYDAAIDRRAAGEPVAYIRGIKEFYGLAFAVDRRALIPRPETERLVDLAQERVRAVLTSAPRHVDAPPYRVWDVGTGCGAVAIALAVTLRRRGYGTAVRLLASDRSTDALALATENAVGHGAGDLVTFAQGDLLEVPEAPERVDLVVANLPYIPTGEIPSLSAGARFEPHDALDGGSDGLDVVRRLLIGLPDVLAPEGAALVEIGAPQADAAIAAAHRALAGWQAQVHPDLSGQPRVLEVRRPASPGGGGA